MLGIACRICGDKQQLRMRNRESVFLATNTYSIGRVHEGMGAGNKAAQSYLLLIYSEIVLLGVYK